MGDRSHGDDAGAAAIADREDHHAGAVFRPLLPALPGLVAPEIGVANDEAGLWLGRGHAGLRLQLVIEAGGFGGRPGDFQGLESVLVQLPGMKRAPVALLQPPVLLGGEQDQTVAAVAVMATGSRWATSR